MKFRSLILSSPWLPTLVILAGMVLAAFNNLAWLGLLVVVCIEIFCWWRAGKLILGTVEAETWLWLGALASVIIATLNPNRLSQVCLIALYGGWRWWLIKHSSSKKISMLAAAVTQGLVLWAVFLAAAVWHWPTLVVLALVWASGWLIARRMLSQEGDRAAGVLALSWALIVAECSWVFSLWLVNYIIFGGFLIVPQSALVITALGYCFAGIYSSHRRSQLSRSRLIEYLMIGLIILVIVIAGTKWNGVI